MTEWLPIESAPKDGVPVLGWCVHDADPYYFSGTGELSPYGAWLEGGRRVEDGPHVVIRGGGYSDSDGEFMPDWWFRDGSDYEEVANPVYWTPIPDQPFSEP